MADYTHEYEEQPDGTLAELNADGPCCQECGDFPAFMVSEYKEYPDGSLEYVRDLDICCGCAAGLRTWHEYKEYPDDTLEYVRDTTACCDCADDFGSLTFCKCQDYTGELGDFPTAICLTLTFDHVAGFPTPADCDDCATSDIVTTAMFLQGGVDDFACAFHANFTFCGDPCQIWLLAPTFGFGAGNVSEVWVSQTGSGIAPRRVCSLTWNERCGEDFELFTQSPATQQVILRGEQDPPASGNYCIYYFNAVAQAPGCSA